MSLYISGVDFESITDAEGVSTVLFVSGCRHNCVGCHSKETHNFKYGQEMTDLLIDSINEEMDKRPYLNALVISGGDPMYSAKELLKIIPKLHIPRNTLWLYTGFTVEELRKDKYMWELFTLCDVVVDGQYEYDKRDITLKFRGSSNQRIIDVQDYLYHNKIE
jgi:anaerobic ribonucleoside-triphosphate reductase activating protein